jgi:hypothetical protein
LIHHQRMNKWQDNSQKYISEQKVISDSDEHEKR